MRLCGVKRCHALKQEEEERGACKEGTPHRDREIEQDARGMRDRAPLAYSQIDYGKVFSVIFQLSNLVG